MKRIVNTECGTKIITHNGNLLGPIIVILNHSNKNDEYILIGEKDNIGTNSWCISLLNPEYIEITGDKMNQKEKDEFINIISNNWNNIINKLEEGCNSLCDNDKYSCIHYKNRVNLSMPDYTLLD